jgi:proteic killer suppression protein
MEVEYENRDLKRLAYDPSYRGRWSWETKKRYQKVLVAFDAINQRESLFPLTGMNFERMTGKRKGQKKKKYDKEYSVRLDGRNRVVFTFIGPKESEIIRITFVGDYH